MSVVEPDLEDLIRDALREEEIAEIVRQQRDGSNGDMHSHDDACGFGQPQVRARATR